VLLPRAESKICSCSRTGRSERGRWRVDLLDRAVVQTLRHGGEVHSLPAARMPSGGPIALSSAMRHRAAR